MADAFGSVGVILAAVVLLTTGWGAVDIIVSLAIAVLLVPRSVALLRHALRVLLEGVPPEIDTGAINEDALTIPGVTGLHDLHVWSLAPSFVAMSAHVDLETMDGCGEPIGELSRLLRERYGIAHVTLQPETPATHGSIECCAYPDAPKGEHEHPERSQPAG
jgi:cobalt-zinc-cadmium efflux system protein